MTRTYEEKQYILELWEEGYNKKQIARITGIPRGTVVDCIKQFGSLQGLEENKDRASKSTPNAVLDRIQNPENVDVQKAYAYILGIYLGDGNITHIRRVFRLRVTLDARYPNIITFCSQAVQILLPDNQIGIVETYYLGEISCIDVSCYYKFWPEIIPQHGEGKKHDRKIELHAWQQQIIDTYPIEFFRGLYHSDGSRSQNIVKGTNYPRYSFTNTSKDIIALFCNTCDRIGVHWTIKIRKSNPRERATDIFISKRKDVAYLDSVIGPKT